MHEKENFWGKTKRFCHYYYNKAVREKGTPEYIARGWAIGMFIGFAIPFGFQLIISVPLSFLLKGSKLGAVIGTFATNHFSIFLIYPFQTWLGNRLIGGHFSLDEAATVLSDLFNNQNYQTLFGLGLEIVGSFFLGGLVLALITTPITYYAVKRMVIAYRKERELLALKREARKKAKEESLHGN